VGVGGDSGRTMLLVPRILCGDERGSAGALWVVWALQRPPGIQGAPTELTHRHRLTVHLEKVQLRQCKALRIVDYVCLRARAGAIYSLSIC
jgi:hypothetical protein